MQSLLTWAIENSEPSNGVVRQPQAIDPGIIDMILGRPDSVLMKENMEVATDVNRSEEDRVAALEDFETLTQSIDNANNLSVLKLWEPLLALLTDPESSPSIKYYVLWIIGTATQNNPAAQEAYLSLLDSGKSLAVVLDCLNPTAANDPTRSKAVYALSGLLKHNTNAIKVLTELKGWPWATELVGHDGGWAVLGAALKDPDDAVRRKMIFLLNTLVAPSTNVPLVSAPNVVHANSHASMVSNPKLLDTSPATIKALSANDRSLVKIVFGMLGSSPSDPDLQQKILSFLHTYMVVCKEQVSAAERHDLVQFLEDRRGHAWEAEDLDVKALRAVCSEGQI